MPTSDTLDTEVNKKLLYQYLTQLPLRS